MDNLLQIAMEMILCLVIAALLGGIIGYLLGKIGKCDKETEEGLPATLNSYEEEAAVPKLMQQKQKRDTASVTSSSRSTPENATLSLATDDHDIETERMQAFQKSFEGIEGERPSALSAPRNDLPDDLKEISGIGLKIEEALNNLGIYHFDQIAAWTPENVRWIDNYLVFKGRVNRENWIGQAKILAAGQTTTFSEKVQKGKKKY